MPLLLLTPVPLRLDAAPAAAGDATGPDDEVTIDDQGDRWAFEFVPDGDALGGGGARVAVAKDGLHALGGIRAQ